MMTVLTSSGLPVVAQDSLLARELLFRLAVMHPEIAIVRADSAYAKNNLIPWARASSPFRAAGQLNGPGRMNGITW